MMKQEQQQSNNGSNSSLSRQRGSARTNGGRSGGIKLAVYFFGVVIVFGVLTFFLNFHSTITGGGNLQDIAGFEDILKSNFMAGGSIIKTKTSSSSSSTGGGGGGGDNPWTKTTTTSNQKDKNEDESLTWIRNAAKTKKETKEEGGKDSSGNEYHLAGLNCDKYGGPSEDVASEMVYWKDIPDDSKHISPFHKRSKPEYLTFEPDHGGWNNIRMAMEVIVALAFATGRTLVLPPEDRMYLLGKAKGKAGESQRKHFSFNHFFNLEAIHDEHAGLDIISMEEFLEREGLTGRIRNNKTGKVVFPPNNRTDWSGQSKQIFNWLRDVAYVSLWKPDKCLAVFPATTSSKDVDELRRIEKAITSTKPIPNWGQYVGKPTPVDAPIIERLKENWADRNGLCIYDQQMQSAPLIHIPTDDDKKYDTRMLIYFYAFVYFQDWNHDLWMKRFIRDHVRYMDEIQCAAARVVAAVRKHARERDPKGNPNGVFDTFHVRRGDFQYKGTRYAADKIYEQTSRQIPENSTVFIGTDERDKSFFDFLKQHYDIVFLDDFHDEIHGVNTNYYGMIDALVASRGRYFFGCWFSTFTGYINRIRGYHADNNKSPGYEQGIIPSWYYALKDRFDHMQMYYPVKQSFFAREFPTSWRLIETGMEAFHAQQQTSTQRR